MSRSKQLTVLLAKIKLYWKNYLFEGFLAIVLVLLFTWGISIYNLYSGIHHATLVIIAILIYVLTIEILAFKYGLFSAFLASIAASTCLDYYFTSPLYTLAISNHEEVFSSVVFLALALFTGVQCAESRRRTRQALISLDHLKQRSSEETLQRERQFRLLFQIAEETSREKDLERQLKIIAKAIVDNFEFLGVRGCIILLPDKENKPVWRVSWPQSAEVAKLLSDEAVPATAKNIMENKGKEDSVRLDLECSFPSNKQPSYLRRVVASTLQRVYSLHRYAFMMPIPMTSERTGVLLLLMEEEADPHIPSKQQVFAESGQPSLQREFFWKIKDHIATVAEGARLRHEELELVAEGVRLQHEELELEMKKRNEELHANLNKWVSHGIRSPLTAITNATSVLHEKELPCDNIRTSLESIEDAAEGLNRFVDDLLDMTRSKGGTLRPQKIPYYIDDLVYETLEEIRWMISDRSVVVNVPELLLKIDPIQIGHVLANLIENAVRYTPADSPIEINAQMNGKQVRIDVADRGLGIRSEDRKCLFEPFSQGSRGSRRGYGLGLAACQALVEAHGGHIDVKNREGGGAIFYFILPLLKEERGEDE